MSGMVKKVKTPIEIAAKQAKTVSDLLRADTAIDAVNKFVGSGLTDVGFVLLVGINRKSGSVFFGYGGQASPLELEGLGLRIGDVIQQIVEQVAGPHEPNR